MAFDADRIFPRRSGRGIIIGKTGSGKTMVALYLLKGAPSDPLYLFDTKNDGTLDKYFDPETTVSVTAAGVDSSEAMEAKTILVRPTGEEMADHSSVDFALDKIYTIGNRVVYLDEASQISPSQHRLGPGLINLLSRGRSRGITVLSGSQRPAQISRLFFTESEQFYIFQLGDLRDRKRVYEFVPDEIVLRALPKHEFIYYDHDLEKAIRFKPAPLLQPFRRAQAVSTRRENFRFA